MSTTKEKFLSKVSSCDNTWITENDFKLLNPEEIKLRASIALELRRYMKDNSLKQSDLAKQLSVSPQYVNKILRGRENLTLHTFFRLNSVLNLNLVNTLIVQPKEKVTIIYDEQQHIRLNKSPISSTIQNSKPLSNLRNVFNPKIFSSFENRFEYSLCY